MALRQTGAFLLALLVACSSTTRYAPQRHAEDDTLRTRGYEVEVVEPVLASTHPVTVERHELQQALRWLAKDMRTGSSAADYAHELLEMPLELEGEWVAEVYRGRVYSLVPLDENTCLAPELDAALRGHYHGWCARAYPRRSGDCLSLLAEGGPFLRTDDRRTLALALAFGKVLEESREALERELLDPDKVLASVVWMVGLYLLLWLNPEPAVTKGLAASLTVLLVAWLGLEGLYELVDGYFALADAAHRARTFDELREAGDRFSKVMGDKVARALILAVASLAGRTAGEVAGRVKTLPGYTLAAAHAEAQGLRVPLAVAVETVETVVASPEGGLALVMVAKGRMSGAGGASVKVAVRHRGGNQQVVLANGQRWHVPRGKTPRDIPASDPVGDQLQEAATRAAREWTPEYLTDNEKAAIARKLAESKYYRAYQLQRQAMGRWVEERVRKQFLHLDWRRQGVDVMDPTTGRRYEVLAGTDSNMKLHGRRMAHDFFRMIVF